MTSQAFTDLEAAIAADDVARVDRILREASSPAGLLNEEACGGKKPILASARSAAMAAKLLEFGADVARLSEWWAPGFTVNPGVDPAVGRYLIEHGAAVTAHAAAGLGLVDVLKRMLDADPNLVRAKGGDGCTPLHFARDVETAVLLLDRGADIDARDDDHDSTPAQWLIASSPGVTAFLIQHGATPDLFLAAALGDRSLAERIIRADPGCLGHRIGKAPFHPLGQSRGGTILQWTLGFNCYAHQVASRRGHDALFRYLFDKSDATTQLLVACVMADRAGAESILSRHPDLVSTLGDADRELVAKYCWETNASLEAVRLMLDLGFPIDFPERVHGYSPLHNAAWGGYGDLVELLIRRGHPVALRDPSHNGTPLDWALHCCLREGRHPEGEYGRVAGALIDAGCPWDAGIYPTGNHGLDQELRKRMPAG